MFCVFLLIFFCSRLPFETFPCLESYCWESKPQDLIKNLIISFHTCNFCGKKPRKLLAFPFQIDTQTNFSRDNFVFKCEFSFRHLTVTTAKLRMLKHCYLLSNTFFFQTILSLLSRNQTFTRYNKLFLYVYIFY